MKIVNQAKLTINEINFADSTFTSFGTSSSSGSMVLRGRGRMWCSKSRLLELRSNFPLMQIKKIITRIRCKNFIVLKRLVLSVSGCRLKWDHQGPYKSHWCKGCKNRRIYFALKISKQLRCVQCTYPNNKERLCVRVCVPLSKLRNCLVNKIESGFIVFFPLFKNCFKIAVHAFALVCEDFPRVKRTFGSSRELPFVLRLPN